MGFSYCKSVGLGPFRVNLGSRGVGWSVGAGGFRTGVSWLQLHDADPGSILKRLIN